MPDAPALAPTGHSILGMSVLERRLGCPGSAQAERGLSDRTTPAAARGTLLHNAAARALTDGLTGEDVWQQDDEGAEIIDAYLDTVLTLQQRYKAVILIEHQFALVDLHPDLWGTADAVLIGTDPDTGDTVVVVIDLKTGRGKVWIRRKDGGPNLQLAGYGLGALSHARDLRVSRLELHVVQPLNGGHTHTSLNEDEILDIALDIQNIAVDATKPDAPRYPGDWCEYCRAAGTCPALRAAGFERARLDFEGVIEDPAAALPAPSEMDNHDIAAALAAADMLDLWISATRQRAADLLRSGQGVQGYKIVARAGRRRWRDEDGAARYLQGLGFNPYIPKLVSPAQAEKSLKAHAKQSGGPIDADISLYVETPSPGTAVVPETDPRPAIVGGASADHADVPTE